MAIQTPQRPQNLSLANYSLNKNLNTSPSWSWEWDGSQWNQKWNPGSGNSSSLGATVPPMPTTPGTVIGQSSGDFGYEQPQYRPPEDTPWMKNGVDMRNQPTPPRQPRPVTQPVEQPVQQPVAQTQQPRQIKETTGVGTFKPNNTQQTNFSGLDYMNKLPKFENSSLNQGSTGKVTNFADDAFSEGMGGGNPYNLNEPYAPENGSYQNPSQPSNLNPTFGETDKYNIPGGVVQPFNFEQQRAENQDYLKGFETFLGSQEKLPAIQQRYENRYGIPDLQETYLRQKEATDFTGNQIRGLPESVKQRTNESMITQGQMDRMVNVEAKGLLEQYNSLGQLTEQTGARLQMAESNLNNAAKLELAQMQKDMTPWLQAYEMQNIMQAREFSGWGTVQQMELNRLIGNRNAGQGWDNAEAQRANALAQIEKQFEGQLKLEKEKNKMFLDLWA